MTSGAERMTAVEICRVMAAEIWRGERPHEHLGVHGLNSERAVRERLQKIAMELEEASDVADPISIELLKINWGSEDPLSILEKTEAMITAHRPGAFTGIEEILNGSGPVMMHLIRLAMVQSLAGRLGRWALRAGEIPDARTARTLFKDLGEAHWNQYRALLVASGELAKSGRHRDAAVSLLDADRLVRTAEGLLQAAVSLSKAGDFISALWAVRACLLEPKSTFESEDRHFEAHRLEGRLRAIIEGRAEIPLAMDEAVLLAGDTEVPPEHTSQKKPAKKILATKRAVLVNTPPSDGRVTARVALDAKLVSRSVPTTKNKKPKPDAAVITERVPTPKPSELLSAANAERVAANAAEAAALLSEIAAHEPAPGPRVGGSAALPPPLPSKRGDLFEARTVVEISTAKEEELDISIEVGGISEDEALFSEATEIPPEKRIRATTLPPTSSHRRLLSAERDHLRGDIPSELSTQHVRAANVEEEQTEIPSRPKPRISPRRQSSAHGEPPPPAKQADSLWIRTERHRTPVLPAHPGHRQLLEKERDRFERALEHEGSSPWEEAKILEHELLQLVSDTFDVGVDVERQVKSLEDSAQQSRAETEEEWRPVAVPEAERIEELATDHESPTDTEAPLHIVLTGDVLDAESLNRNAQNPAHEVTERIRDRSHPR